MTEKVISREKIQDLLKKLGESYNVFAPVQDEGKVLFMSLENSSRDVVLEFKNALKPPKEVFFPQTDILFTFMKTTDGVRSEDAQRKKSKPNLIFAIRPCDVQALQLFDKVFSGDYQDSLYLERREDSIIISMVCSEPQETCFCTSVGGSPVTAEADIILTDLGDQIFASGLTESGEKILEDRNFKTATREFMDKKKEAHSRAEGSMKEVFNMNKISEIIGKSFEKPFWNDISRRCINCYTCTFLCPTCHCFDITDVKRKGGGERIKTWDSCMSPLFTLHASGHNPRGEEYSRWRQRLFHKFKYLPDNLGLLGCVGCGRCLDTCPTGMDIREILNIVISEDKTKE
ncbi:MAG: 4Fe-4S ferredoxin [Candidatus Cloacimonadota bacterium]|nr:MAG: 4Fe-4S ferredoxin [Candidatus Cloacimonadota bacterium]